MHIPIVTEDITIISNAIDQYKQGKGPPVLGQFLGKGSTELIAIRRHGKYFEGRYPACREDEWHQLTGTFFYETEDTPVKQPRVKAKTLEMLDQLAHDANSILQNRVSLHDYILELESLLEEYRDFATKVSPQKFDEIGKRLSLLEHTNNLLGESTP